MYYNETYIYLKWGHCLITFGASQHSILDYFKKIVLAVHMMLCGRASTKYFGMPMMLRLGGVTEAKWDKGSQQKSEVRCLRHLTPTYFHSRYGYSPIKERKNGGKEMSLHRKRCEE